MKLCDTPLCRHCGCGDETPYHFLYECETMDQKRMEFLLLSELNNEEPILYKKDRGWGPNNRGCVSRKLIEYIDFISNCVHNLKAL